MLPVGACGPSLPVESDEGQEEFVDDGADAGVLQGSEVHDQVVPDQFERHVQHRGRDASEVEFAAIASAPVDVTAGGECLDGHDPFADLGGGQARVGEQAREGGGHRDGEEGRARLAHRRQVGDQITAQGAGVRDRDGVGVSMALDRGEDQLVLVGPPAVQHRLTRARAPGHRIHREPAVTGLDQLLPRRCKQLRLKLLAMPTSTRRLGGHGGHGSTIDSLYFLSNQAYPIERFYFLKGGWKMSDATSPTPAETMVLIVGAGPTGLTLACELARKGIPFRLIEAGAGPQPGSRGKGVQPRTLEVFEDLGIIDRVLSHGRMAMPMRSTGPDGAVTLGGAEPESLRNRPDIPYTTSLITPQWRVEQALRSRLAEFGGDVEFGTTLERVEQSGDAVSATIVTAGEKATIIARWLVGCDGGRSIVRKQSGIAFTGETREGVRMLVADLAVEGLDRDAWHMWRHPEGAVSLCPLPSTALFQFQASITPGQNAETALENLQAILERRSSRTDIRLNEPEWSTLWRANVRLADRYRAGRVLLAGDAAHVHSPAGGQGMNTGIQDAHNLGWKLAAVAAGAPDALLDSYEAERRPIAADVLEFSDARLAQALEQQGPSTRRDASTIQLDVGYRGSALAQDDRGDAAELHAGDRAPDATRLADADAEHRLFDLTSGGRFTLLDFTGTTTVDAAGSDLRTLHIVEHPTRPDEIADVGGHLAQAYHATPRSLVLIRPDGYIALITDTGDTHAVADYLARIH